VKRTDCNKDTDIDIRFKIQKERTLWVKPEKYGSARYWKLSIREKRVHKIQKGEIVGEKILELFIH
jgi:hypothetical protein